MGDPYGCQSYGETQGYNSCVPTSDSNLADTGASALISIGVGALIIVVAISFLIYSIKNKKKDNN